MAGLCSSRKRTEKFCLGPENLSMYACVREEKRRGGGRGEGEGGLGRMIVVALPSFVILNSLVGF